jgi:hypothetical protein
MPNAMEMAAATSQIPAGHPATAGIGKPADLAASSIIFPRAMWPPTPDTRKKITNMMNLAFYLFVNLGLVVVWGIFTDVLDIRFFWPIVPLLGWGMGLAV